MTAFEKCMAEMRSRGPNRPAPGEELALEVWNYALDAAAETTEAQAFHSDFFIQNEKLMADKIRQLKEES